MAIESHRNSSARLPSTLDIGEFHHTPRLKLTATSAAAVANHFIWRRSSPRDRRYRSTTETNEGIMPTGMRNPAATKKVLTAGLAGWLRPNWWDQTVAPSHIETTPSRTE